MVTRISSQLDPNTRLRQQNQSPSNDVWIAQTSVVNEWGLGEQDMWARLVDRHNEILQTGGVPTDLWRQLGSGLPCTCIKPETGQVNQRCPVCYGSRFVGGFEKFGYSTIFVAASTPGLQLDSGLVIAKKNPWQLELASGKTQGVALTPSYYVTQSLGYSGSVISGLDGLRKLTQEGILVEYTTNGIDFLPLLGNVDLLEEPSFYVTFRITLTRASASEVSPFFQILRARWQMQQNTQMYISKRSFPEQRWLESFGVRVKLDGVTWWTTPNLGIVGQEPILIQENDLFEINQGIYQPQDPGEEEFPISGRYKPANVQYVEPKGRFLSQRFNIRHLQRDEGELLVF